MEKKTALILLTHTFPDKINEVFLWNELPYMNYDHVYIVPMTKSSYCDINIDKTKFSVIQCGDTLKFPRGVRWWLAAIVKRSIWAELREIKREGKLTFSEFAKTLRTTAYGERIVWTVNKKVPIDRCDSVFAIYSYWLTSLAYAANKLKEQHKNCAVSISRCHGHDLYAYRYANDYIEYQKSNLKKIDMLASISKDGIAYLKDRYGINCCRNMFVSHLGTEDKGLQEHKRSVFTIVSCSRIVKLKRINLIIDALFNIDDYEIRWEHFGNGPCYNEIKTYAEMRLNNKANISYVFHGQISNQELMEIYKNSSYDLFINVSETEGIPVTIMEALSFGIPVVATNVGGCSELIDESCGFLLSKSFMSKELTTIITSVLNMNPQQYSEMRKKAREKWLSEFSAKHNYSQLHNILLSNMLNDER